MTNAQPPFDQGQNGYQSYPSPNLTPNYAGPGYNQIPTINGIPVRVVNKHLFVWVFAWLLGAFGADRFVRGQIGLGIMKLLFSWVTLGIWPLADWIISLVKAYGGAYSNEDNLYFYQTGQWVR